MPMLIAMLNARPEKAEEVASLLRGLARHTSGEPGCDAYAVHRLRDDPNGFVVYERYRDQAACDAHFESAPLKEALTRFEHLLMGPPMLTWGQTLAVGKG